MPDLRVKLPLPPDEEARIKAAAVTVIPATARTNIVLTCEHASHAVPAPWHDLGLTQADLTDHIGWDPGTAEVTRVLAGLLGCDAVLAGWSRLFAECNRMADSPDFIAEVSDQVRIPGNAGISAEEKNYRKALAVDPFHETLSKLLEDHVAKGVRPLVLSIHSFTPHHRETGPRRWHAGILWKRDRGVADRLHSALAPLVSGPLGLNEPYDPHPYQSMTLDRQILSRDLPHAILEIRNDLISTPKACEVWAGMIKQALDAAGLPDPATIPFAEN